MPVLVVELGMGAVEDGRYMFWGRALVWLYSVELVIVG
jgi:hypothetical protein